MYPEQRELVFHDTVPIEEENLQEARDTARKQNECILAFFRERFSMNFTPNEVWREVNDNALTWGMPMLLTSVRRSITNLTKEGRLIKCQWSESRPGAFKKLNRVWTYNRNFLNPLNPKK